MAGPRGRRSPATIAPRKPGELDRDPPGADRGLADVGDPADDPCARRGRRRLGRQAALDGLEQRSPRVRGALDARRPTPSAASRRLSSRIAQAPAVSKPSRPARSTTTSPGPADGAELIEDRIDAADQQAAGERDDGPAVGPLDRDGRRGHPWLPRLRPREYHHGTRQGRKVPQPDLAHRRGGGGLACRDELWLKLERAKGFELRFRAISQRLTSPSLTSV